MEEIGRAMTPFAWFKDDPSYCLPVEGHETRSLELKDGYSQWLLGPGADFDLTEELKSPGSNPADYCFVVEIGDLADPDEGVPVAVPPGARAQPGPCGGASAAARAVAQTAMVAKLPVRAASVAPAGEKIGEPSYSRPAGLDPDRVVIIGILDDSINIAHERFLMRGGDQDRSRVDFAWVQDGNAPSRGATVAFGREWTREEIEAAVVAADGDEEALMLSLDLVGDPARPYRPSPLRLRRSHGTHVMDLAAGYAADDPAGLNRRIVAVQLPTLASQDTSGASLMAAVVCGLRYVFDRAFIVSKELGVALPVILNFSYGFGGGARNGEHVLERAMTEAARAYRARVAEAGLNGAEDVPVEFTLPAGNMALVRGHAASPRAAGTQQQNLDLPFHLQPDDRTSTYIELWLPRGCTDIAFSIGLPTGGSRSFRFDPAQPFAHILAQPSAGDAAKPDRATLVARLKVDTPNAKSAQECGPDVHFFRLLIALAPTLVLDEKRAAAPAGRWTIGVQAKVPDGGRLEAWIQRDESILGMGQRGRQAYFEDAAYDATEFDRLGDIAVADTSASPIRRDGTVSGIASVPDEPRIGSTVAGSYFWRTRGAALYTAAGSDTIKPPEVMAATDTSRVLPGILAAGSRSGSVVAFSGTSMAAPQVARLFADTLAALAPEDRGGFDRNAVLTDALLLVPPRPDAAHPELAASDRIRRARVDLGLLVCDPALVANVARGSLSGAEEPLVA